MDIGAACSPFHRIAESQAQTSCMERSMNWPSQLRSRASERQIRLLQSRPHHVGDGDASFHRHVAGSCQIHGEARHGLNDSVEGRPPRIVVSAPEA